MHYHMQVMLRSYMVQLATCISMDYVTNTANNSGESKTWTVYMLVQTRISETVHDEC